ncbi:histidinol-phosphate amidotransferase [Synechococcus elongatus PCC 6301]|uniref:Histidinol-phosphate aminotransferase n=1 Tax=Synechococcus sp. (strain ATCC 27144 / PCC 6301 / SAUG 1402/1) TaxID=269084 RepID=HIS8_SYNP6|nr:histidinol-phosphate transaminase [Synechococcus elongatus]Q5N4R3.1 RecName: Full=Histidinol-phosphate aminotransferase; AltName: Full=Imidazole acetol-phosphate transaminase [Synechococcus elongatus PCC 6301]BAD78706.1 histidinol-phosphate amidotransferase [Synechococcus elongatus PCC 6301]
MLPFLRSELARCQPHHPNPGGTGMAMDILDTNECPYDLPTDLKQTLADRYVEAIASNRYPDGSHTDLKAAIVDYLSEQTAGQWQPGPEHVTVGNGSDELIRSILIATCLGGQGSVLVAEPTFSMYGIVAETLGIPVVRIGRDPQTWEMDLAAAETAITQTEGTPVRLCFVVHPNSPTANPLTEAEKDWLRQVPPQILVVIDEAYFEFSGETLLAELPQHPNWLITRTFSKALRLAAHRVGYGIGDPQLIAALEAIRLPYNLPSVAQLAATLALEARSQLLSAIPRLITERDRLYRKLQVVSQLQVWPSASNFLFLKTQSSSQTAALAAQLKAQGTLVRHTADGLRITIGSPAENERTLAHLQTAITQSLPATV